MHMPSLRQPGCTTGSCRSHPFQDGNGRVARALASIVLLRAELFPLHVRREDREDYLDALERADGGSLDSLVQLFAARERNDVLWAVSELARDAVAPVQGGRTADVAAAVAGQYVRKRHEVLEQRRRSISWRKAWLFTVPRLWQITWKRRVKPFRLRVFPSQLVSTMAVPMTNAVIGGDFRSSKQLSASSLGEYS